MRNLKTFVCTEWLPVIKQEKGKQLGLNIELFISESHRQTDNEDIDILL